MVMPIVISADKSMFQPGRDQVLSQGFCGKVRSLRDSGLLPNWNEISDRTRRDAAYRCHSCSIRVPRADSKFLHAHHKNGQKNDCHAGNLEVLCIACHANEPMHGHMKAMPLYYEFLAKYGAR
jgi:hypothetical protein